MSELWNRYGGTAGKPSGPKEPLLVLVKERVSDRTVLELMQRFLEQDVMEGMKRWTPIAGTPQGSVISPLMSNLYCMAWMCC